MLNNTQECLKFLHFYFRRFKLIIVYIRQHHLVKFLSLLVLFLFLSKILVPNLFSYSVSYFKIIVTMVNTDMERQQDVIRQEAEVIYSPYHPLPNRGPHNSSITFYSCYLSLTAILYPNSQLVWGYHQMQKRFMHQICKVRINISNSSFLVLVNIHELNYLFCTKHLFSIL